MSNNAGSVMQWLKEPPRKGLDQARHPLVVAMFERAMTAAPHTAVLHITLQHIVASID